MASQKLTTVKGQGPVRRLQMEVSVSAPIDKVWNAITDSEHVRHWWTDGQIDAEEGGRIVLDDGSELNGTIKVLYRPYIFEFTWHDSPEKAKHSEWLEHNTKSLARFDLVEVGESATHVTLIQYSPREAALGAAAGWHHIAGERLKAYLEAGVVSDDAGRFEELKAVYAGG